MKLVSYSSVNRNRLGAQFVLNFLSSSMGYSGTGAATYVLDGSQVVYESFNCQDKLFKKWYKFNKEKLTSIIEIELFQSFEHTYEYLFEYFDNGQILMKKILIKTRNPMDDARLVDLKNRDQLLYKEQINPDNLPKENQNQIIETKILKKIDEIIPDPNSELTKKSERDWRFLNSEENIVHKDNQLIITKDFKIEEIHFESDEFEHIEEVEDNSLRIYKKSGYSGKWLLHCLKRYTKDPLENNPYFYGSNANVELVKKNWRKESIVDQFDENLNLMGSEYYYYNHKDEIITVENDFFYALISYDEFLGVNVEKGVKIRKECGSDINLKTENWYEVVTKEGGNLESLLNNLD